MLRQSNRGWNINSHKIVLTFWGSIRLKQYAKQQGISLNNLFYEFATVALAQFDAKTRFELQAAISRASLFL